MFVDGGADAVLRGRLDVVSSLSDVSHQRTAHDHRFRSAKPRLTTNPLPQEGAGGRLQPMPAGTARGDTVVLDEHDKAIIEQLQQDGRRPYTQIAKAVGLSEAAIRQRVQRLIEGGVMQIVAVTDPLMLGFQREAMIGIRVEGDVRAVAETVASIPEVDYVVLTAGSFDLLIEVVVEDDDHLLALLNDKIRPIPGVATTETFIYLKLLKQTYQWGTR